MSSISIADPRVEPRAVQRVKRLLEEGQLADGPPVRRFEHEFAEFCGVDHAIATANGTAALHAALVGLGLDDGAVITSPFTFVATANAIELAGGTAVFADIDRETFTLDPEAVEDVLARRDDVAGILPVHLYGLPAEMGRLADIAAANDVFLLADACQAHGARVDADRVGGLGDAACFSFYPTKNMTSGEGGMVTTDSEEVATRIRSFVDHGRPPGEEADYRHRDVGHNFRMTSLAAAIGRTQLETLPDRNGARRRTAVRYDEQLRSLPVETPLAPADRRHVYHQYTIRASDRSALRDSLAAAGIESGVYYPRPLHEIQVYAHRDHPPLERAERAAETVLSLPVHPALTPADRRTVVQTIADHYGE